MSRLNTVMAGSGSQYEEESVKPVAVVLILLLGVITIPLGWFIYNDLEDGAQSTDISKYSTLAEELQVKTDAVRKMLSNEAIDESMMTKVSSAATVTLITPDVEPGKDLDSAVQDTGVLDVKLKAIYWNPVDPLITVGDENYTIGEKINGFTIVEIRKTSVLFRSPLGDQVVKYFYDYLDKPKRN